MDCIAQADGQLRPLMGGSPFNMARAAALRGAETGYLNPLSTDYFGAQLAQQLQHDKVLALSPRSPHPTSLAVVQITNGQPSYGFYREGVADRDYTPDGILAMLRSTALPGVLHTGSLALVPPEHEKVLAVVKGAKALGWTISVDVNLRPKLASSMVLYRAAVFELASLADWLKASDEDWSTLGLGDLTPEQADTAVKFFTARGTQRVALTFGAQGAYLSVDGQVATQTAPQVKLVDTVGAGDTFWGNCLADWAMNTTGAAQRVTTTLGNAMLAAAINCSRAGCQPPTFAELDQARTK
ncbi:MAG: 2-dehydro-3-deoxygluconokinase [Pseudomonadota bacterium]